MRPHALADGLALKTVHQAVTNTPANTISIKAYGTAYGERCTRCGDVNEARMPEANRRHTRAVKTYIQDRYFLNASKTGSLSGDV
jgi:phage FluMu protein Com